MNALTQLNGLLQSNGGSMAELNGYTLAQMSGGFGETLGFLILVAMVIILVGTIAYQ